MGASQAAAGTEGAGGTPGGQPGGAAGSGVRACVGLCTPAVPEAPSGASPDSPRLRAKVEHVRQKVAVTAP